MTLINTSNRYIFIIWHPSAAASVLLRMK